MAATAHHGNEHGDDPVFHQFEDYQQQTESYIVGMWTFLVTEIMFFGALFLCYLLYRWKYQPDFYAAHQELEIATREASTRSSCCSPRSPWRSPFTSPKRRTRPSSSRCSASPSPARSAS